ncbi:MAG: hypothetical protein QXO27_03270 [Candidatus Aenigmatarchaeota archaeon]
MVEKMSAVCEKMMKHKPYKMMFLGIILFVIGLLKYLGYDWNIVLMALGVLFFLKGIALKMKD